MRKELTANIGGVVQGVGRVRCLVGVTVAVGVGLECAQVLVALNLQLCIIFVRFRLRFMSHPSSGTGLTRCLTFTRPAISAENCQRCWQAALNAHNLLQVYLVI